MNVMQVERATRMAWPALEEKELPFGILRYAAGVGRRSNALSLFPDSKFENNELIELAEKFFLERNAAPAVRIVDWKNDTGLARRELELQLESRGYKKQAPTYSMILEYSQMPSVRASGQSRELNSLTVQQWLRVWYEICERNTESLSSHKTVLSKVASPRLFLAQGKQSGLMHCCGMGVYSEEAIGLFGIVSARDSRKQGHASQLLLELLRWGKDKGAKYAYLQVDASNSAAISLYKKMGFRTLYSYWYRVRKT